MTCSLIHTKNILTNKLVRIMGQCSDLNPVTEQTVIPISVGSVLQRLDHTVRHIVRKKYGGKRSACASLNTNQRRKFETKSYHNVAEFSH